MLKYTICFIKQGNKILLVNREKPGWMGSWNGVGGHIEENETPTQCIIREIHEETGLKVNEVKFKGIVTWLDDDKYFGGMYTYIAEIAEDIEYKTPISTPEGILDWKTIDWILHPRNTGVARNIPTFLPVMLNDENNYEHACYFTNNNLIKVEKKQYTVAVD